MLLPVQKFLMMSSHKRLTCNSYETHMSFQWVCMWTHMSLIRCFRAHAIHMRNNRKKCMRSSWKFFFNIVLILMRNHMRRRESDEFSYMRKIAKTHVLIRENLVKLICEYKRKFAKNHTLIYSYKYSYIGLVTNYNSSIFF